MNKDVLQSSTEDGKFSTGWPSNQLLGSSSVAVVEGLVHKRLRKHLMEAFNNRKALALHLVSAQPFLISTLEEWVSKRKIVAYSETKTVGISNV